MFEYTLYLCSYIFMFEHFYCSVSHIFMIIRLSPQEHFLSASLFLINSIFNCLDTLLNLSNKSQSSLNNFD